MQAADINRAIAALAADHHGLVRLDQAEALGITRKQLHRRVEQGLLDRVDDGIFRVAGAPVHWPQEVLAGTWAHGPDAMASHRCSAMLRGLDGIEQSPIEVLVPRWSLRQRRRDVVAHETTSLRGIDRSRVGPIPCTSVVRTLLDLPAVVHPMRADQAIEDALRKQLCSVEQLADRFTQLARRGRPGTRVGRSLIEKRLGISVPTRSEFERRVVGLVDDAGLPAPDRQIGVPVRGTTVHIDLGWRALRIGIECDGLFDHGSNISLPWDDDRQNELVLQGWLILRFTWDALIQTPDLVIDQLRQAREMQAKLLAA